MTIQSFKTVELEVIHSGKKPGKRFPAELIRVTQQKLLMLDSAQVLDDLKSPPGNKLHALKDDRLGQHAVSVNKQFRLCFVWTPAGPSEVEFADYH